jgi:hypothetical protein
MVMVSQMRMKRRLEQILQSLAQMTEVHTTPDVVQHTFYRLVFGVSFSDTPVLLADMQTADGIDTANLRWQNKTSTSIDIRVAEEQSKGTEINHMTEVVGFIAIR